MFDITGPHRCPQCPPIYSSKSGRRLDQTLEQIVSNYSGCGVDIARCPRCERTFQISYKVDQIEEVKTNEEPPR